MKYKTTTLLGNYQIDFMLRVQRKKYGFALGTYSVCQDGKHVIYLDYDNFREEWIRQEITHLITKYKLSDAHLFKSSTGKFHVVIFDKISARLYEQIVKESNADGLFKYNHFFDYEHSRVLRFSGKTNSNIPSPKYYGTIRSQYHQRQKSLAHIRFYSTMFKFAPRDTNNDGNANINIISYLTRNLGKE